MQFQSNFYIELSVTIPSLIFSPSFSVFNGVINFSLYSLLSVKPELSCSSLELVSLFSLEPLSLTKLILNCFLISALLVPSTVFNVNARKLPLLQRDTVTTSTRDQNPPSQIREPLTDRG